MRTLQRTVKYVVEFDSFLNKYVIYNLVSRTHLTATYNSEAMAQRDADRLNRTRGV